MNKQNCFDFKNTIALITGAAGLLGEQHAKALLSCGAKVVLTDINQQQLETLKNKTLSEYSENIILHKMDVTDRHSIQSVYDDLKKTNLAPTILINNAAIDPKVSAENSQLEQSRFEDFSLNDWNLQMNVGLTGAFLCSQIFGTAMAKNKSGVILNIASDLSVIAPDQRLYRKNGLSDDKQPVKPVTYSVIKTGLIGLTRYLAAYWANKNVRVNALSPGGVFAGQDEQFVTRLCDLIPMGRMATLEEYHGAIQFLCSDASRYMTGQNMVMDGGRSII